ncbi:Ig-like domain-containing protein [Mycobacterium sp. EPa45]|uniref:Ig-like domain-containing protein n=1 Tax=Mycobacterium sp. EPa45 TaxID=1545728 RepID=UPI0009E4DA88|nr:Ig-like domain-containing protein [Mycobacterium sp. EPa45]
MISSVVEKSANARPGHAAEPGRRAVGAARATAIAVGLSVVVAVLAVAFALPAARSKPHDVPIGVAGPHAEEIASLLVRNAPGSFRVTAYPDQAVLRGAIRDRDAYGGVALGSTGPILLTATSASPAVAQTLSQLGNQLSKMIAVPVRTEDLAPPTAQDPRGAGLIASGLPITIAGLLPAILLVLLLPSRIWLRIFALLLFSGLTALTITAVLVWVVGSIDENVGGVAAAVMLGLGGAGLAVLGLGTLFGRTGLALGSALALLLGNPLSGMTSAPEMLPGGWGAFGQYLPQGATVTLLRSAAFFNGAGAGAAITVLICWAVGGAVLMGIELLRSAVRRGSSARFVGGPAAWLGAGAIAVGIGAALAQGSAVADADTGHSSRNDAAAGGSTGPAAPTRHRGSVTLKVPNTIQSFGGTSRTTPAGLPKTVLSPHDVVGWIRRELRYTLFNKPPVIAAVQHSEDPVTGVVTGDLHDANGSREGLTYTVTQPDNAVVHVNPDGTFSVAPDANTAHLGGSVSFTATAENGSAYRLPGVLGRIQSVIHYCAQRLGISGPDSATATVTVDVASINKAPTIGGYSDMTSTVDGTVSGQIEATDPNQDSLRFSGPTTSAGGGAVTVNADGSFTYAPTFQIRHAAAADNAPEAATTDSFTVTVSDGYSGLATQTITVPVSAANGKPSGGTITGVAVDDVIGVVSGAVIGVTDPDSDPLSYSSNPTTTGGGIVDVYGDGSFTYNPTAEQRHLAAALGAPFTVTHDSFTISVADGHGGSTAITVVVPVAPEVDEPPTGVAAG